MRIKKVLLRAAVAMSAVTSLVAPAVALSCGSDENKIVIVLDGPSHTENDKSFNQSVFEGITEYLGSKPTVFKPSTETKDSFLQMYSTIPEGSIIVAPGYAHIDPISKSTHGELANKRVILLDGEPNFNNDNEALKPNIASVIYKPEQAAFVAGYVLAKMISEDGELLKKFDTQDGGKVKISTFGGADISTVTGYMSGFEHGVNLYATQNPNTSKVEWFSFPGHEQHFSKTFNIGDGAPVARNLITAGVDIIFPVAGPQMKDVIDAFDNMKKPGYAVGVDSSQEDLYTDTNRILFSITKNLKLATLNLLKVIDGGKTIEGYEGLGHTLVGDISNNLVGISDTDHSTIHMKSQYEAIVNAHESAVFQAALGANTVF